MAKGRIDARVEIGYVRLQVRQLDEAVGFYGDVLGLAVTHRGPAAVSLSADGHRTHLVLEAGTGGRRLPGGFTLRFPTRAALAEAVRTIDRAGAPVDRAVDEGVREAIYVRDPDGNEIALYWERDGAPSGPAAAGADVPRPLDINTLLGVLDGDSGAGVDPPAAGAAAPLTADTRSHLVDMRVRLLNLHKVLLEDAKHAYELDRGRVGSNASLLQLVISDPWFAWLHPLSELVVRMDETLRPDAPATDVDGVALLDQVEALLAPGASGAFAQRYYEALQRQPAVILAHAEVRRILKRGR